MMALFLLEPVLINIHMQSFSVFLILAPGAFISVLVSGDCSWSDDAIQKCQKDVSSII